MLIRARADRAQQDIGRAMASQPLPRTPQTRRPVLRKALLRCAGVCPRQPESVSGRMRRRSTRRILNRYSCPSRGGWSEPRSAVTPHGGAPSPARRGATGCGRRRDAARPGGTGSDRGRCSAGRSPRRLGSGSDVPDPSAPARSRRRAAGIGTAAAPASAAEGASPGRTSVPREAYAAIGFSVEGRIVVQDPAGQVGTRARRYPNRRRWISRR
jgi:hypothetical protein